MKNLKNHKHNIKFFCVKKIKMGLIHLGPFVASPLLVMLKIVVERNENNLSNMKIEDELYMKEI